MSLIDVIKVQIDRSNSDNIGIVTSEVYRVYDAALQNYVWVVNVDLQQASTNPNAPQFQELKAVPIDDPSREAFDADIGTQVSLKRRQNDQQYVVNGLAKFAPGTLSVCLVTITDNAIIINDPVTFGFNIRKLTYDEIGGLGHPYGALPYGTSGKFDLSNTLIQLIIPQ
jgi:hypothetical protein